MPYHHQHIVQNFSLDGKTSITSLMPLSTSTNTTWQMPKRLHIISKEETKKSQPGKYSISLKTKFSTRLNQPKSKRLNRYHVFSLTDKEIVSTLLSLVVPSSTPSDINVVIGSLDIMAKESVTFMRTCPTRTLYWMRYCHRLTRKKLQALKKI